MFIASASSAQTPYDGLWSVEIVAKAGAGSLAYAVPIKVAEGNITYVGFFGAVADGKVGSGGDLRASLAQSGEVVLATGALLTAAGSANGRPIAQVSGHLECPQG